MIKFFLGPMASGKTARLVQMQQEFKNPAVIVPACVIKAKLDKELDGAFRLNSRNGTSCRVTHILQPKDNVVVDDVHDSIFVDEINFLSRDQILQLFRYKLPIFGFGLRFDWQKNCFGAIDFLMEFVNNRDYLHVEWNFLKSTCQVCWGESDYDQLEFFAPDGDFTTATYKSVCDNCYDCNLSNA